MRGRGRTWSGATVLNEVHNHRMLSNLIHSIGNVFMIFFHHFCLIQLILHSVQQLHSNLIKTRNGAKLNKNSLMTFSRGECEKKIFSLRICEIFSTSTPTHLRCAEKRDHEKKAIFSAVLHFLSETYQRAH